MKTTHSSLLPNGLEDLLPPYAGQEADLSYRLINDFAKFGYRRVKTPLAEFEESLLGGAPWSKLAHKTFRVMDPVSKRMMGVRSDTTPQIGRIALSRLKSVTRPLRLSYCADILRAQGSHLRPERQYCQVGCELIGFENVDADVEIILIAVHSLIDIGVDGVSVDLCLPSLVDAVFAYYNVSKSERVVYRTALEHRDRDSLQGAGCEVAQVLCVLIDAIGRAERGFDLLAKAGLPDVVLDMLDELKLRYASFMKGVEELSLKNVSVTLDLVEKRGFEYQKGIGFALFAKGVRGELGRGGRYDVSSGDEQETAVGFTLYMDSIRRAVSAEDVCVPYIYVATDVSWSDVLGLQDQGYRVIRGVSSNNRDEIVALGCSHQYKDGQVIAL